MGPKRVTRGGRDLIIHVLFWNNLHNCTHVHIKLDGFLSQIFAGCTFMPVVYVDKNMLVVYLLYHWSVTEEIRNMDLRVCHEVSSGQTGWQYTDGTNEPPDKSFPPCCSSLLFFWFNTGWHQKSGRHHVALLVFCQIGSVDRRGRIHDCAKVLNSFQNKTTDSLIAQ